MEAGGKDINGVRQFPIFELCWDKLDFCVLCVEESSMQEPGSLFE